MDTSDQNCSRVIVASADHPVRCTEEVLLPFFTDESLQVAMTSQQPPASHSVPPALAELRLVLLGRKGAGKSAAGNTILGGGFESGKPTEECVKRRADVAGRKVTVVDTPGWEWYYPLNSTPNWVRRETLRSVSLCPSGPHAVLLVVRSCASVTEEYLREIEEHLEPLGKQVWEHTMLLFTRGDELGLVSMEQRILASGPALQRLLQNCGSRYHVVDNRSKGDGTQVKELMRKLELMVEGKKDGSDHLEMDGSALSGLEADGKRRARERRKKQRQMEEQMQRGTIKAALMSDGLQGSELDAHQSFSKAPRRLPEIRLVLLGERETGKSSAGNTILGKTGFFQAGAVTEECTRQQAEVGMRLLTVVDTPGWEGGVAGATPERVKREIVSSLVMCPPGPHALLLTLRVDTLVMAGHVREHLELLGEGVWRHTLLLFTHGDQLREGVDIEQHIQGGGRDLQLLLEKCRGRYHVISSLDGGGRGNGGTSKVMELLQKVEKMAAMNRCEAFSGLVQDVRDLSRQRNEKFNQRLKDMGDKMLRQEVELKNMREREMKSIRWFFNRKDKAKSPGKADVQREEEEDEDRRPGERKNDIVDLEERMRWLTEDKEREIQDLSIEKERIRVALNQSRKENDEAALNLELKEREIEELKERIDEQQLKLLDLERAGVENEHERKQREDAVHAKKREWMSATRKLEENIELQRSEKEQWMEKVESLKTEMDETKRRCNDILQRQAEEKNRETAEVEEKLKTEMRNKLSDKDKELEDVRKRASEEKQVALDNVKDMEGKLRDMKSQHEKETERRTDEIQGLKLQHQEEISQIETKMETMTVRHQEELHRVIKDNTEDRERVRQQHESETRGKEREIAELKEQLEKEKEEQMQEKKRHLVQMEGMMLENKERETVHVNLRREMAEKEKEVEVLKQQHQEETARKTKEMEARNQEETDRKEKEQEEEVRRVQQQYSDERQREITELKQRFEEEREAIIRDVEQKHAAQINEKVLENEKEKELMHENHERERDRLMEELKHQHLHETKARMREVDRERERIVTTLKKELEERLEEKESEIQEVKLKVKGVEEELQQKEAEHLKNRKELELRLEEREVDVEEMKLKVKEVKDKLQEEETGHLKLKRELEQKVEEREREIKETKERLKEVERQVQRTEEERERDLLNHGRQVEQKLEEKERQIDKLNQHMKDVSEILQRKEEERGEIILNQKNEAERRLHNREREMEEMKLQLLNDMESKVREKESEIQSLRQQADSEEARWREEQRRKDERAESEMKQLLGTLERRTEEVTEVRCLLEERDGEIQEAKKTCAKYFREVEELTERCKDQTSSIAEMQQRHAEQERRRDGETRERLQEKDDELHRLRQRDGENEKELAQLRLVIEQTKSELKALTGRMETETTSMIREYEKEIARRDENIEAIAKERDCAMGRLKESQRTVEELQEQNEKMRKEADNLVIKCQELKEESEEEVRRHLKRYEERVKSIEAEIESIRKERDVEVRVLKEANDKLQGEIERMKEREGEAGRQRDDTRERLEAKLREKQDELSKRQRDVGEREKSLRKDEEELSKRGHELHVKAKELGEKEVKLESKEQELSDWAASLGQQREEREEKDRREQEVSARARRIEKMERELESMLRGLEGKQKELNCHGQDLQEKVKGLKDQGRELKDREHYLRSEEQELLNWKSELQVRNEHVNSATQQLDEMGRDLALLKEELHNKERNLKASLKKLSTWEQNLKEREEALLRSEGRDLENGQHEFDGGSGDNTGLMYTEVHGKEEKGRGRESDRGEQAKDREDHRVKTAPSAAGNHNCHLETVTAEEQDEMRAKVIQDFHRSSNNKGSSGSEWRVVVLGESWSSRSPTGVSILGGQASKHNRSDLRQWRGQIAGRRLAVAEPLGLRWRDGPEPNDTAQRKSILDGVSWCRPGPQVVLLLMPALLTCTPKYRRAVEEHASLLGEGIWQRTLVVFTWGELLGESAEQHILRNGELMKLVERCGGRYHVVTSKKSKATVEGLFEKMEEVVAVNCV